MEPKLSKINPISGFGRLFSKKSLVELIKSLIKIFAVGFIAWSVIKSELNTIMTLSTAEPRMSIIFLSKLIFEISFKVAILLVLVALVDFLYQKWQWQQDLKMSKQEIKEEFKQMEGDPLVKRRIRSLQMDMARKRMMSDVPESDVVITNPTHYSVAIRYKAGEDKAPKVLAKGQRLVALRIREIAKENGILIHEDPPLARSIYSSVEIGEEIPENLYKAVAEILAFVYQMKNKN
jgi:flagellar biosynthetic protein FlhB